MPETYPEPVLTPSDLRSWSRQEPSLAVLGSPVRHSVSPQMHHAALAELARIDVHFAAWRYFRIEVSPGELPQALGQLHALRFAGLNLTLPHKVAALGRVAKADCAAQQAGAVNTLLWTEQGWSGFNTDGYGLARAIQETLGLDLAGAPVVLLGAGGAARGAAAECLARGCSGLWIANRTPENLEKLLSVLRPLERGTLVRGWKPSAGSGGPPAGSVLINATSSGLRAGDPAPVDLAAMPRPAGVYDMTYNPAGTALLHQARGLGIPCANGLSMLAHQGAKALEIWTGAPADRTAPLMLAAALRALGNDTTSH